MSALRVGLLIDHAGVVKHTFGGDIKLGSYENSLKEDKIKPVLEMFAKAQIKCEYVDNIKKAIWLKALWNNSFNPLSALLEKKCGQLINDKHVVNIMKSLMDEVIEAAMLDNIYIDEQYKEETLHLCEPAKSFKTTMLQDVEALKRPEIDGILMPIIKRLEKKGKCATYHRILYNLIDAKYGKSFIYTPKIAADTIVLNSNKEVLLIKRKNPPYGWAIPGGFIDYNEKAEDGAIREIFEETGLKLENVTLFGVYSDPARDSRGHTVSVVYYSSSDMLPKAGDDAVLASFFSFQSLPDLAFDHSTILKDFSNKMLSI